ncbi:MAG: P-II family nitrogen regulator [Desulfovibrionaceae bacterium]|nr:P-II family nitrogen regulator [Desulfovibrionaceae bacterium]
MKKIEALIRPSVFEKVKKALTDIGVHGMNYTEIRGFGRQHGHTEVYRATTRRVDFLPKVRIEVVCADSSMEKILEAIVAAARTGHVGDGKIFVSEVLESIRIRTGERGDEAV